MGVSQQRMVGACTPEALPSGPAWLTSPPSGPLLRGGCLGELSGYTSFSGPSLELFSLLPAPGQVRSPRGDWLGMPGDGSTEPTPSRPPAPCFWPCLLLQVSCPSTSCPFSMDAHPSQPQLKPQVSASSVTGTTRTGSEASCAPTPCQSISHLDGGCSLSLSAECPDAWGSSGPRIDARSVFTGRVSE